ncbi:hypothetical protein [Falsiroseomonas sp. CW058]|uniref:hypothetical protein n=1 Tax=Falsiroseomonas sp. CW058 TaxID=3388664 RepID=UPI003D3120F7
MSRLSSRVGALSLAPSRGPTARLLLGLLLFGLSILVQTFDAWVALWMTDACRPDPKPGWCSLADLGLVKVGLGSIWAALFASGLFYLVLYDWLAGFLRGLFERVVDSAIHIKRIAVDHIDNGRMSREDIKELCEKIFSHSTGHHERLGREFGRFVHDGVCARRYAVWRSDYTSNVLIEDLSTAGLRDRYFLWDEKRSYRLVRAGPGPVPYLVKASSVTEALPEDVGPMVRQFAFRCSVSGTADRTIDLSPELREQAAAALAAGGEWAAPPFLFRYAKGTLVFRFEEEISVDLEEVVVTTVEKSFLLKTDTEYVLSAYSPVHGMKFWFKVPPGYHIDQCHASIEDFEWEPGRRPPVGSARIDGRDAEVTTSSWMLPGIACVVIWKPNCE